MELFGEISVGVSDMGEPDRSLLAERSASPLPCHSSSTRAASAAASAAAGGALGATGVAELSLRSHPKASMASGDKSLAERAELR